MDQPIPTTVPIQNGRLSNLCDLLVWNVHGVGSKEFFNNLKEFIVMFKLAIITLLEIHISVYEG